MWLSTSLILMINFFIVISYQVGNIANIHKLLIHSYSHAFRTNEEKKRGSKQFTTYSHVAAAHQAIA